MSVHGRLAGAALVLLACRHDASEDRPPPARARASQQAGAHPLMGVHAYPRVQFPPENPDDDQKALLGKVLFWDEQLSGDDSTACGSCHRGRAGGSDPRAVGDAARLPGADGVVDAHPSRTSDDGRGGLGIVRCDARGRPLGQGPQVTARKPPSAFDAMFNGELFWDGRAAMDFRDPEGGTLRIQGVLDAQTGRFVGGALESQAVGPLMNEAEMACASPTWAQLDEKLARVTPLALASELPPDVQAFLRDNGGTYPRLFAAVFGAALKRAPDEPDGVINAARIAFAIATYERRLTSNQTPWDRWNAGDASALTPRQVRGYELFMDEANCQACHTPPLFEDVSYHYLGFHPIARDRGRGAVDTDDPSEVGMMKTPSLRNVGLREPGGLLHQGDGPGHDLASVLRLYNDGGRRDDASIVDAIDPLLVPLKLSDPDLDAIADFLRNALTDPRVRDERPPFDRPRLRSER